MAREKNNSTIFSDGLVLEASDLVKTYKGAAVPALNGLNIKIRAGEIVGLLGPNGAGKTTAISIMSTLLSPDAGHLRICGKNALKRSRQIKKHIGLVPQDIALYDRLTARENLIYFGRILGLRGATLVEKVETSLAAVGLADGAGQQVGTFSGGMKRRINLAAGMLHNPRLLFLDEPTVGIDAQSRNLIFEKLVGLKAAGTAILYTTHYMEEAEQLCDYVVIIDAGGIISEGPPSNLITCTPGCRSLGELFLGLTGKALRD